MQTWAEAQAWEKQWHGDCVNSLNEEQKQLIYARKMGLRTTPNVFTPYNFDLGGKSIVDIGGGAYSLLLKCDNFLKGIVVEPLNYTGWVTERYKAHGVYFLNSPAEDLLKILGEIGSTTDECWCYNVLQHVQDPEKIINNMRRIAKVIRIFEWVDNGISNGHIHDLKEDKLNLWLKGEGKVEFINEGGCVGKCYYGIFPT